MKSLILVLTVTLFTTISHAQGLTGQQFPPEVQIINSRFDLGVNQAIINHTNRDGRLVNSVSPANDGPQDLYKATVIIKNNGTKRVKAITWGAAFIDLDTQKEVIRRKFRHKKSFAPGAVRTLTRYVLPYYKAGTITVRAVIDRVEYDDGSVWQHP